MADLSANPVFEPVFLDADAEKYRQEIVSEGEAQAIHAVYGAIHDAGTDDRVIAIKYLESLENIANGNATKIFLPADMSATLGSIGGIAELFKGDGPDGGKPSPERKPKPRRATTAPTKPVAARPEPAPAPAPQPTPPQSRRPTTPPPPG